MITKQSCTRLVLLLFLFFAFVFLYPSVFEIFGYMYEFKLEYNTFNLFFSLTIIMIYFFLSLAATKLYLIYIDLIFLTNIYPMLALVVFVNFNIFHILMACIPILVALALGSIVRDRYLSLGISIEYPINFKFIFIFSCALLFLAFTTGSLVLSFNVVEVFWSVYEVREKKVSLLVSYMLGWVPLIILPYMGMAILEWTRFRAFLLLSGIFLFEIILFVTFAIKIHFLYYLFIIIVALFYKYQSKRDYILPFVLPCLVVLITPIFLVINPLLSGFSDRFFYIIGVNSFYYFDYFSSHPLKFFEGSFLGMGIEVYGRAVGYIIDDVYYQGYGVNHSAGAIPTIFADLGIIGLCLLGFLIWSFYFLIYRLMKVNPRYCVMLLLLLALTMSNHQVNMLFISNGFSIVLIFALLAKIHRKNSNNVYRA